MSIQTQGVKPTYPIVADWDRQIAFVYGMLDDTNKVGGLPLTVRGVFFIDPKKIVRLTLM
jgi:alkyl hydroperoxide reductase subunit AhpC